MKIKIERDSPLGKLLIDWWSSLDDSGPGRADRAVLRRAESLAAIEYSSAFQRLYQRLEALLKRIDPTIDLTLWEQQRIAAGIGLLAHVKEDRAGQSLPQRFSKPSEGNERAPVSELRFVRLLDSPDIESLLSGLRRTLPLIEAQVDLISLFNDVFYWGDDVKRRWAYDYQWQT